MKILHLVLLVIVAVLTGCAHPEITAYDLNRKEPVEVGMPYYLPKYYFVVSKNVRYIPMPTVGLTQTAPIPNSFDSGSSSSNDKSSASAPASTPKGANGGDTGTNVAASAGSGGKNKATSASTTSSTDSTPSGGTQLAYAVTPGVVPATAISDGLIPETFYTYQFVALPDLTQKYGLKIKGGAGELRTTLNLVNGWMFTGPGPLYMRDSFTSQNILASGTAAEQVTDSLAKIASMAMGIPPITGGSAGKGSNVLTASKGGAATIPDHLDNFAIIGVWEIGLTSDKKGMTFTRVDLAGNSSMSREIVALGSVGGANSGNASGGQTDDIDPTKDAPAALALALKDWKLSAEKIQVTVTGTTINVTVNFSDVTLPNKKTRADFETALDTAVAHYAAEHTHFSKGQVTVK
jgi:hypothetical protein